MILSTHAIVGGALANLLPSHPVVAITAGFASHFAIDAIPHRDYPLQFICVAPGHPHELKFDWPLLQDIVLIGIDGSAGMALALGLFAAPATVVVVLLGALAAMLPDPLRLMHSLYPNGPLKSLQRFHHWIHTNVSWIGRSALVRRSFLWRL